MQSLYQLIQAVTSVQHAAQTAAANGTGVDCSGYEGAVAVLHVVALGGTTPSATYVLQESDDDVTYTTVAAADLEGGGQPPAFTAAGLVARGYLGSRRYLRWRLDALSGTSPTVTASGTIVRGHARHQPAGQPQTP